MIRIRKAHDRGHANHGWLDTYHTFSFSTYQDARVYLSSLDEGRTVNHTLEPGRHAWLQVLRGSVNLNGQSLQSSDGAAVSEETGLDMMANQPAEIMLFDLN